MATGFSFRKKTVVAGLCIGSFIFASCAPRMAMVDDRGKPISAKEMGAYKSNKNFWVYTLGGGALSFGISFFAGSMLHRASSSEDRTALWAVTGAGTAAGMIYFAHLGKVQDHNKAVEMVKGMREAEVNEQIAVEKKKQGNIGSEQRKLQEERKRQEREKEELLKRIKKKQKDEQP